MRKLAICLLVGVATAAAAAYARADESTIGNGSQCCNCCNCCNDCCGHCGRCHLIGCLGDGGEGSRHNCCCHGSYKYPVPPQYTYFWPGIYSQRVMTEYVSPYRYPPLNPWKWDESKDFKDSVVNSPNTPRPAARHAGDATQTGLLMPMAEPDSQYKPSKEVRFKLLYTATETGNVHVEVLPIKVSSIPQSTESSGNNR